jgi:hypothetical protein
VDLIITGLDDAAIKAAALRTVYMQCDESGEKSVNPECAVELMALMARAVISKIKRDQPKP